MRITNLDILQNFKKKNYTSFPFPHLEINNALPENIYSSLKKEYLIFDDYFSSQKNLNENNVRIQISSEEVYNLKEKFKKSLWYDFIKYHNSLEFFDKLVNIFKDDLLIYYPQTFDLYKKERVNNKFLNFRSESNKFNYEFVSDCQPGINTPVKKVSSVRGPHVDNPVELFGGLFYLRDDEDKSIGGDLILYEKINKIYFHKKAEVENVSSLRECKKIKYKKNNCVFFLNSESSIHSVSPRQNTNNKRYLTNIIFERYKNKNFFFKLKRKSNIISKLKKLF